MIPLVQSGREYNTELKNVEEENQHEGYTLRDMWNCVKANKYMMVYLVSTLIAGVTATSSAVASLISFYLFDGKTMITSLPVLIAFIPGLIINTQADKISKRFGRRNSLILLGLVFGGMYILQYLVGYENIGAFIALLERGEYLFRLGDTAVGIVSLDADAVSARLSHSGGEADFEDWQPQIAREIPKGLPCVPVSAAALGRMGHYDRERVDRAHIGLEDFSGFSDRELATICVGKHSDAEGMAAIIGNSASRLAGGAGETASIVTEKGYGTIVMADGPAGLRLATKYLETEEGQEGLDADAFDSVLNILPPEIQQLIRMKLRQNEEKAKNRAVLYHYASAIPIGTALAQAWNPAVAEACGDLVGEEMELFGANLWLAPAMNIHRSPLCGRNFEYYSEDPLISGKTAAAVTRGVQQHPCCAVTIKHFACNNQETNRFGSNSVLSQRALREIYLKGFEICVKEADPKALMSSYNLLNGTHTANRGDLITTVLRGEWGFEGVVMTDWGTTNDKFNLGVYGASSPALCIKAGNDLMMAGSKEDVEGILSGLRSGSLSRRSLEACAGRILALSQALCKTNRGIENE